MDQLEATPESKDTKLVQLGITDKNISDLRDKYNELKVNFGDSAGYKLLTTAIAELRNTRVSVEKKRKALSEDAIKWQKNVNTEAKRITKELELIELPLKNNKKQIDDEKERIKNEKRRIELERVEAIKRKISYIEKFTLKTYGKSASDIKAMINELSSLSPEEKESEFEEFIEQASAAHCHSMNILGQALVEAENIEIEKAKIESERAELERRRKLEEERLAKQQEEEQKRIQAERAKIEAERIKQEEILRKRTQEEQERIAAQMREQKLKEQKIRKEQEKLDDEKRAIEAEKEKKKILEEAKLKEQADAKHRKIIEDQTHECIMNLGFDNDIASSILEEIKNNRIKNVRMVY